MQRNRQTHDHILFFLSLSASPLSLSLCLCLSVSVSRASLLCVCVFLTHTHVHQQERILKWKTHIFGKEQVAYFVFSLLVSLFGMLLLFRAKKKSHGGACFRCHKFTTGKEVGG